MWEDNTCFVIIDNIKDICKAKQIAKLIDEELFIKTGITIKTNLYNLEDLNFIDRNKIL